MKRLAKVEKAIEEKLKKQAKRYNKSYVPRRNGAFQHQTAALIAESKSNRPEGLPVCRHCDYSRELYAAILPGRTAAGAAKFLLHDVIDCCPYTIECAYSDNGMEYRGNASHPFAVACVQNNTGQKFTRIARP